MSLIREFLFWPNMWHNSSRCLWANISKHVLRLLPLRIHSFTTSLTDLSTGSDIQYSLQTWLDLLTNHASVEKGTYLISAEPEGTLCSAEVLTYIAACLLNIYFPISFVSSHQLLFPSFHQHTPAADSLILKQTSFCLAFIWWASQYFCIVIDCFELQFSVCASKTKTVTALSRRVITANYSRHSIVLLYLEVLYSYFCFDFISQLRSICLRNIFQWYVLCSLCNWLFSFARLTWTFP